MATKRQSSALPFMMLAYYNLFKRTQVVYYNRQATHGFIEIKIRMI